MPFDVAADCMLCCKPGAQWVLPCIQALLCDRCLVDRRCWPSTCHLCNEARCLFAATPKEPQAAAVCAGGHPAKFVCFACHAVRCFTAANCCHCARGGLDPPGLHWLLEFTPQNAPPEYLDRQVKKRGLRLATLHAQGAECKLSDYNGDEFTWRIEHTHYERMKADPAGTLQEIVDLSFDLDWAKRVATSTAVTWECVHVARRALLLLQPFKK